MTYDLLLVGGGPAGVAAAVYAASLALPTPEASLPRTPRFVDSAAGNLPDAVSRPLPCGIRRAKLYP